MQHVHLDPVGGVAGDMIVAALIDAAPEHEAAAIRAAEQTAPVRCQALRHHDHVFAGTRFVVRERMSENHGACHPHRHTAWADIRARLDDAPLTEPARQHAIGIFSLLAQAEARVHGIEPEAVTFHEVGAADSIADIVAAAVLIDAFGTVTWSVTPLPLGSGRVRTAHGLMPVPAPATAILLEGFEVIDDGIGGERVTPTGAAILRHLCLGSAGTPGSQPRRLSRSGIGFGSRTLPGISNCLRVLIFEAPSIRQSVAAHRELAVVEFEVDDQSAEDLAAGLDRIREMPGIHDVVQMPVFGKKGRLAAHVRVLVRPDMLADAIEACFRETTTIGLRYRQEHGQTLPRRSAEVRVGERSLRVKIVHRPDGLSSKAEADDVRGIATHDERARLRHAAERLAEQHDSGD